MKKLFKETRRYCLLAGGALVAFHFLFCNAIAESPSAQGPTVNVAQKILSEILLKRPKPLTELRVEKTFRVTDFGAQPNSRSDALPALRAALAAAVASRCPSAVVCPKGTYYLDLSEDGSRSYLALDGAKNLVFDGNGSEFILRNPRRGFIGLKNCDNLIIRNFTIDYDPLPFTQGVVRAVHPAEGTFDVQIEPGFAPLDAPHLREPDIGFLKDRSVPGRQKPDVPNFHRFTSVTRLPDGLFRVKLTEPGQIRDFATGDHYVSIGRAHASGGVVWANLSNQVTCQNIICYAAPGANYVASACDALNVLSCQTKIRAGRWQSTNADGVHCQSNRIGPWIENCLFEGMGDDGVNVYTLPFKLTAYPNDGWIPGAEYHGRTSDRLTLFDPTPGRILDTFRIAGVDAAKRRFRLDKPLPEGLALKDDKLTPSLYNQELSCPYAVIRNNVFKDYRGRGLLIKSHWSLIEGNRFEGVSNGAIQVVNNCDVPEGFQTEHLAIRNNQITDCGYDGIFKTAKGMAAISVYLTDGRYGLAQSRGQRDILIENNTIAQWRRSAIYLGSTQQVQVVHNTITNNRTWPARPGDLDVPIRIENSDQIEITANSMRDTRPVKSLISVDPSCGSVKTHGNTPGP